MGRENKPIKSTDRTDIEGEITLNKFGIHLANGPQDIDRVASLGCDCYTVLHGERRYLKRLRELRPDAIINLRQYDPDIMSKDPATLADHMYGPDESFDDEAGYMRRLHEEGITDHVMPGNELNLAIEGGGWTRADYERINRWVLAWVARCRELAPWAIIHFPAFASGHSEDQADFPDDPFVGFEICREAAEACDVIDHHDYWEGWGQLSGEHWEWYAFRFQKVHTMFPDKPIFISECSSTPNDPGQLIWYFEALYGYDYVIGATPFLWDSPDPRHWAGRIVGMPVEQAIKNANKPDVPLPDIIVVPPEEPEEEEEEEPVAQYEFTGGFKDKAIALGPDIVGEPLEKEKYYDAPDGHRMGSQWTTKGRMEWVKEFNNVEFFAGVRPLA